MQHRDRKSRSGHPTRMGGRSGEAEGVRHGGVAEKRVREKREDHVQRRGCGVKLQLLMQERRKALQ